MCITKWVKILQYIYITRDVSENEEFLDIYKKKKCNFRKNNPGLEMVLHGESIQVANKHMKRCSNSAGK